MGKRANPNDVLRIRRHQPTRLEGFVDSVFAFAVTPIVISERVASRRIVEKQ